MILWTIQPRKLYEEIMETGSYAFDATKNPFRNDYEEAYAWIEQAMSDRGIRRNHTSDPLVWAWHTWDGAHRLPQLNDEYLWSDDPMWRNSEHEKDSHGRDEVLLEIEVPDDQVLLSDYDAWHFVLNEGYYGEARSDDEADAEWKWFATLPANEQKQLMEASWLKIFNISRVENDTRGSVNYIQATFFGLKKEQILHAYNSGERKNRSRET